MCKSEALGFGYTAVVVWIASQPDTVDDGGESEGSEEMYIHSDSDEE